jgi:transcriptional regulator with PAS, ATPase and Fis domain
MVARQLHEKSDRSDQPFIAVNVAAIAPGVAESELFGHVRGAFTDARETRQGLFQQAHGGTLFLDEIGDLEPALQAKLLRAIQERRIKPVGGNDEIEVDIRLVSATNRDLAQRVREGRFRQDLYYRINVVTISLPPLRDRSEDIPMLAGYFLARFAARAGRPAPVLSQEALAVLSAHTWPGNVRELENVMQRAMQFCTDGVVTPDLLSMGEGIAGDPSAPAPPASTRQLVTLKQKMEQYVLEVLQHTGNNMTQAAKILNISRRTIQRMAARRRKGDHDSDTLSHDEQD